MARYYETPDHERERMPRVSGVCKDCGNGSMDNNLNYQFEISELEDGSVIGNCRQCGSSHLDLL